jgi:hypothetical protein
MVVSACPARGGTKRAKEEVAGGNEGDLVGDVIDRGRDLGM